MRNREVYLYTMKDVAEEFKETQDSYVDTALNSIDFNSVLNEKTSNWILSKPDEQDNPVFRFSPYDAANQKNVFNRTSLSAFDIKETFGEASVRGLYQNQATESSLFIQGEESTKSHKTSEHAFAYITSLDENFNNNHKVSQPIYNYELPVEEQFRKQRESQPEFSQKNPLSDNLKINRYMTQPELSCSVLYNNVLNELSVELAPGEPYTSHSAYRPVEEMTVNKKVSNVVNNSDGNICQLNASITDTKSDQNNNNFKYDFVLSRELITHPRKEFPIKKSANEDRLVVRTTRYMNNPNYIVTHHIDTSFIPIPPQKKRKKKFLHSLHSSKDSSSSSSEYTTTGMPSETEVCNKFNNLVDSLHLSESRSEYLKSQSVGHKWELLQAQESVREGRHSVSFYMNQLERHLDPQLTIRSPSKKLLKGLITIETLLTSLEVDLRSNPNATWLRDFIDEPNCGHVILLKFLKYLQDQAYNAVSTLDRGNLKTRKLETVLMKEPNDEHLCLLCLKAIVRNKYGFHKVLSAPRSLSIMAWCLRLSNFKTKMAVLRIFSEACEHPGGFEKTLQALEDYKHYKQERHRFEGLVHSVIFGGRFSNPTYQEMVLHFFNAIIHNAPSLNQHVFHQQELEQAGFTADKVEQLLDGLRAESIREELSIWCNNYIDVATTLDEFVILKGRSAMLRDEVNLLQSKLEDTNRERNKIALGKNELQKKVEEYKLRASEIHGKIENMKTRHHHSEKEEADITHDLENVVEEMLRPNSPIPPPPPPPINGLLIPPSSGVSVPPPPSLDGLEKPQITFRRSNVRLPMLNWQPISSPSQNSIFMQLSPDTVADKLDFEELDKLFQLKTQTLPNHNLKREAALQRLSSQVTVLNSNKARNLLIAKKRISLDPESLDIAINMCDIVTLPAETAELLLKFTPTVEERSSLLKNSADFDKMAEAEKFMTQLIHIERLEGKLNTMAFMGTFDELFRTLSPQIEAIIAASISVSTSYKLSQLLEIILAYGNYINGARRGFTQAFKLNSLIKLDDIKTNDKKMTFLQYLVDVIRSQFPDIHSFHEDVEVQPALNISMQTLAADVQHLRKGLDIAKCEREKQSENYALHIFYTRAMLKVQQISDRYRKMEDQYREVCLLFCEESKTTEPSDFFNFFHTFIERYKRATREIDAREQEDKTLQKAERLKSQTYKIRDKTAFSADLATEISKRRMSATYATFDINENPIQRPMSEDYTSNQRSWLKTVAISKVNHGTEFINENGVLEQNGLNNDYMKVPTEQDIRPLSSAPDIIPIIQLHP